MTEPIQEVFWLTSADYQQLLYVSPAFETIWGRPLESLYTYPGSHLQLMVDSIYPSDREQFVAAFAQPLQYEYKAEYRIVRPDGSIRWMRSRCFPIRNSFGETWAIAGLSEDITESKRAEKLLHQRQQEFTALVEHSPDIISRFDRQLRHIYVNPALELATGMSTQEFMGKTHRELGMPQELISLWEPSIERVFQTRQPDEHEFSYLTPQGWKYYQSRLFPEFAADGSVETVLAICRDLTQHKQTQEALRESEQRFRTVFEFAPIGITLTDIQGKLFASNRAFQELIGYTKEELQNQPFIQFTHPDERDTSFTLFQELLAGQRTGVFREKRYCRKDGCIVWGKVAVSAVCEPVQRWRQAPGFIPPDEREEVNPPSTIHHPPSHDANGAFQYAIAMIQDITAQKQAQLELQNAHEQLEKRVTERTAELEQANALLQQEMVERSRVQEALQAQKDFLQAVLDSTPNLIWVKDREDKIVLANRALADFFETTVEDLLGKTNPELHANAADAEHCIAQDREVLNTLREKFIPEEALPTPCGKVRWFQTIKKPIFSTEGQVNQVLGVSTDITACKQAETQIKESLREKEILLQEIHHRVKNNLQVISSLLDLQSQYIDDSAMLEVFRESHNRVRSMALIHEQLYQSKDCARINFSEYITLLTHDLFRSYGVKAGQITLELEIEEISLNINTAIPCGLIINELVSNALKHAFPEERDGIIKVALHSDANNQQTLKVTDNGIGFPEHSEFRATKSLGLQLVNVLANQLEGTLELDRRLGTGFKITFSELSH
jgi:PAS domain S-box-containing protein